MLYSLCYISTKRIGLTSLDIIEIVEKSKNKNSNRKITGVLINYKNNFLQHLEGDPILIYELFEQIKKDSRHEKVSLLGYSPINSRLFEKWDMTYKDLNESIENQIDFDDLKHSLDELIDKKSFWKGIETIEAMSNLIK
ncbi:BLUF domain-containing protein [Crocinitomicaceae bacterium]|nr:BLUF domain-containing protein [Crocinitomicaceae bacterium]